MAHPSVKTGRPRVGHRGGGRVKEQGEVCRKGIRGNERAGARYCAHAWPHFLTRSAGPENGGVTIGGWSFRPLTSKGHSRNTSRGPSGGQWCQPVFPG